MTTLRFPPSGPLWLLIALALALALVGCEVPPPRVLVPTAAPTFAPSAVPSATSLPTPGPTPLATPVPAPAIYLGPGELTRVPYTTQMLFEMDKGAAFINMSGFEVRVRELFQKWNVPAADWSSDPNYLACCLYAGPYQVKPGPVTVMVMLGERGQQVEGGSLRLNLSEDSVEWVRVEISARNPHQKCNGCTAQSFTLDPALGFPATHQLWILYGWNSISKPVVF